MVYRGKPSSSCENCRNRNTKCDLVQPSCSQCLRAGRVCGGYRDQLDLMFCDQNEYAKTKVDTRERKKQNAPSHDAAESSSWNHYVSEALLLQSPSSAPQLQLVAARFFFANYAVDEYAPCKYMGFSRHLYNKAPADGSLSVALNAIGIAGLAQVANSKNLIAKARQTYGTALSLINADLKDPAKVSRDETLASIMLLALYETINCDSQRSMQSYYNHLSGATTLVEHRGAEQYQTESGLDLFRDLRSQIILSCLQKGDPMPKCMEKEPPNLRQNLNRDQSHRFQLADIISQLCAVRALFKPEPLTGISSILETCMNIDEQLDSWSKRAPPSMLYSSVFLDTIPEEICDGYYHTYSDTFMAYLWNCYRSARIVTNQLILGLLNSDKAAAMSTLDSTEQSQKSLFLIRNLISEVLASVPFHLGFQNPDMDPPPAIGGLLLIWNLYKVTAIGMAAGRIRDWTIGRLEYIRRTMGIQQAQTLALLLRKRSATGDNSNPMFGIGGPSSSDIGGYLTAATAKSWNLEDCTESENRLPRYQSHMPPEPIDVY